MTNPVKPQPDSAELLVKIVEQYRNDIASGDYVSAGEVELLNDILKAFDALSVPATGAQAQGAAVAWRYQNGKQIGFSDGPTRPDERACWSPLHAAPAPRN